MSSELPGAATGASSEATNLEVATGGRVGKTACAGVGTATSSSATGRRTRRTAAPERGALIVDPRVVPARFGEGDQAFDPAHGLHPGSAAAGAEEAGRPPRRSDPGVRGRLEQRAGEGERAARHPDRLVV